MSKELEALNKIQHDFGQLKGQELVSCYETIFNALKRLESIDNANPSEALECLEKIIDNLDDYADFEIKQEANEYLETIKQALLKAQEPKHYIKWEDLEFDHTPKIIDVKMSDNKYTLVVGYNVAGNNLAILKSDKKQQYFFLEADKQFFDDLHLERVEE